jgi:hypothetical protein
MSMAWETTVDDVKVVLDKHNIKVSEERLSEIHDELDFDEIEDNVLEYTMSDSQTMCAFDNIENQLMKSGVITTKEKKFSWE